MIVGHSEAGLVARFLFPGRPGELIVSALRFIDEGVLEITGEGVVLADYEVGFGANENAHRPDNFGSLWS